MSRQRFRFFKDEDLEFSANIALGSARYGAAEVAEVAAAVEGIRDGDRDSWYDAWLAAGERAEGLGERARAAGRRIMARDAFLRASTYLWQAAMFAVGTRLPERWTPTWRRHRAAFDSAAKLFDAPFEPVRIPCEGTELHGYLLRPDASGARRPLLILGNGSDGTATDMYVQGGAAALARGYNALIVDGPGQGQALHEQGLFFRPDWEHVVGPVVDWALGRDEVDADRIALQGVSQGGFWVPRAVAYEHRIAAAVADPGVVDVAASFMAHLGRGDRKRLEEGDQKGFDRDMRLAERFSGSVRYTVAFRMRPYGTDSPYEMFHQAAGYRLSEEEIGRIRCPVLVLDPEGEQFWPGQSRQLYDGLGGPREIVTIADADDGRFHCEPTNFGTRDAIVFDWLDRTLGLT